jgi:peptide/nickel transport system permease protein
MPLWLFSRLLQALATLAIAIILLFFLMRMAPGDPLAQLAGERQMSVQEVAALRARYGLDQPLTAQFRSFAQGILQGDLGTSIAQRRPVTRIIAERLPATLLLGGTVLLLNFTLGLWLGVFQARHHDRAPDRWLSTLSLAGYAMPSFWLGLLLVWLVAIRWHWLPAGGLVDPLRASGTGLALGGDVLRHLILPALTLSVVSIALTMRHQRSAMLEVLGADFIRTARAKGLTEQQVIWRHAWRNALFPVITLLGLWLPVLVTGSVFVESVFAWPGLGALSQEAISGRDYPLLMGTATLVAATVVLGNVLADLLYFALDPRVRHR